MSGQSSTKHTSNRTYILTFPFTGMEKFPNKTTTFSNVALNVFGSVPSNAKVNQCTSCKKKHIDNISQHYHMAVKLSSTRS